MVKIAYEIDPSKMGQYLKDKILRDAARKEDYCHGLREFRECWDEDLSDLVVETLSHHVSNPSSIQYGVDFLSQYDPDSALRIWTNFKKVRRGKGAAKRFRAATAGIAGKRLFDFWPDLWPSISRDGPLAKAVFISCPRHERHEFFSNAQVSAEYLEKLYLRLLELFPKADDPPTPAGMHSPTPRMEVARFRDEIISKIAEMGNNGAVESLQRIADHLPSDEAIWIRWKRADAISALRRGSYRPPETSIVLDLVQRTESRWIADEDDLIELVVESLDRLQRNISKTTNSWRSHFWKELKAKGGKKSWRPRSETEMAAEVATWLQADLSPEKGVFVQREIQIQFNKRTDIEVSAVTISGEKLRPLQIVIEAKGCWHPDILTAHSDQLVADYLRKNGRTHGIYLIFWTKSEDLKSVFRDPRNSKLKVRSASEAQEKIQNLVSKYNGTTLPEVVLGHVVDISI